MSRRSGGQPRFAPVVLVLLSLLLVLPAEGGPIIRSAGIASPGFVRAAGESVPTEQSTPVIDNNTVFLYCMFGMAIGVAMTHFSPIADWSYYEGFPLQAWAMGTRGGLGCYYGIILGVVASAVRSAGQVVAGAWDAAVDALTEAPARPASPPRPLPLAPPRASD